MASVGTMEPQYLAVLREYYDKPDGKHSRRA